MSSFFCQGMLAPLEDQGRGFFHAHRKIYSVPAGNEDSIRALFQHIDTKKDGAPDASDTFEKSRSSLLTAAQSLQCESAVLLAKQLGHEVQAEAFSHTQQQQSRLDGGLELDGSVRLHLPMSNHCSI